MLKVMSVLLEQLKSLRKSIGYSQKQIARWTGMHQNEVSRIENGKQDPRLGRIERMAEALGAELLLVPKQHAQFVRSRYGAIEVDPHNHPKRENSAESEISTDGDWQSPLLERYRVDLDEKK